MLKAFLSVFFYDLHDAALKQCRRQTQKCVTLNFDKNIVITQKRFK